MKTASSTLGKGLPIDREDDRVKTFTRRAFVVGAAQGALLCVLGGRLAWLQVEEGARYSVMAEENRINVKLLAPPRGQIVDRFGVPLALNTRNFRVIVVPEQTKDLRASLERLSSFVALSEEEIEKTIRLAKKSPSYIPLEVRDRLAWEDVASVEVNLPDLPGVDIDVGETRSYPFGEATAHLIGYVGPAAKGDQAQSADPLLKLPGFRVGKTGIEKTFEMSLRGKAGASEMEVNVMGREVRELEHDKSEPGERIVLSIDAELQRFAQARLAEHKSASAALMDVHTGALYALASHPAFDPHLFARGISAERWEELLADPAAPLTNKAIAGLYPPGSTFKMITALAGPESGAIGPGSTAYCPGHYSYGDTRFHCWKPGGHGTVNLITALQQSCDTFFYKASTDIGIDRIAAMANRFGLGIRLGCGLEEERAGMVPGSEWKLGKMGERWQPGETIVASIGQGYTQTTPLQLAVMTARLVNGGKEVKPWLSKKDAAAQWPDMGINPRYLAMMGEGMNRVVNDPRGTAYGARIAEPGMEMGGKTGTAQVKRITKAERAAGVKNEDLPWKFRHHALFVGYAPVSAPRYACAVVVEHGVGGSKAAAPIARDLLLMAQQRAPAGKGEGG